MDAVTVALRNDYEVVVRGMERMLEPFGDRVRIVRSTVAGESGIQVDVTVHDTFSQDYADDAAVEETLRDPRSGRVIIYCWNVAPELVAGALDKGCRGYVDKGATPEELVQAIERVAAGEIVRPRDGAATARETGTKPQRGTRGAGQRQGSRGPDYPGQDAGLSVREAEMIALITEGLTNEHIAHRCYLSPNTVKSYIRTAYQKVGVTRRPEAVRWGMEHGMLRPGQHGASG